MGSEDCEDRRNVFQRLVSVDGTRIRIFLIVVLFGCTVTLSVLPKHRHNRLNNNKNYNTRSDVAEKQQLPLEDFEEEEEGASTVEGTQQQQKQIWVPQFNPTDTNSYRDSGIKIRLLELTDSILLLDPRTPQGRAYDWLVNVDKRQLHPDDDLLVQRYVLATLFFATGGDKWHHGPLHFLSELHECHWHKRVYKGKLGVKGCGKDMMVTELFLAENNLSGSIPNEIGYLTNIQYLDLQNNRLTGEIPKTLSDLTNLRYLALSSNDMTGTVPESLSELESLEELLLNYNGMTGTVPQSVCDLRGGIGGVLYNLWTDCDRNASPIQCDCCTVCCDSLSSCAPVTTSEEENTRHFV